MSSTNKVNTITKAYQRLSIITKINIYITVNHIANLIIDIYIVLYITLRLLPEYDYSICHYVYIYYTISVV